MKFITPTKEQLNAFITSQPQSQFLQSWEWGEFQASVGHQVFRLGAENDSGELIAVATLIKKNIGFGWSYLFCPRGPSTKFSIFSAVADSIKDIDFIFDEIKKIAQREKALFLRFEPVFEYSISNNQYSIKKTIDVEPSKTTILDLSKSEDEMLSAMHQKTRYNIRLAEKKGVTIREAGTDEFDKFWSLMSATGNRDGFRLHNKKYYQAMFKNSKLEIDSKFRIQNSELNIELFFAEHKGVLIAANIIAIFGDTATYVHGASSDEHRNVMAPYLLQWRVIQMAKAQGCRYYDFFGVDETKWPGVTRFKNGFAGTSIEYPGTFDLVLNHFQYILYSFIRKVRRFFK